MDQTDFYNERARVYYDNTVELDMSEALDEFISLLPENCPVLDLGCGSGRDSLYLIEDGFDVTAMDGSVELCGLAEIHIGQDVLCMQYEDMQFESVFDGVWACASLVHIPKNEIDNILYKIIKSLRPNGILYMSLKYGDYSGIKDGIYYSEYRSKEIRNIMNGYKNLELLKIYKTNDIREQRKDEQWINVYIKKIG